MMLVTVDTSVDVYMHQYTSMNDRLFLRWIGVHGAGEDSDASAEIWSRDQFPVHAHTL